MNQPTIRSSTFRRFRASRSASVAVLFAVTFPVMLSAGAFATDLGIFYLQRRSLQSAVDSAALAAASWPDKADEVVRSLLDASGQQDATFKLTYGIYTNDMTIDRDKRFVPSANGNAVRVDAARKAPVYFARIFNMTDVELTVRSDASVHPITSLAAGSRLASADPALLNSVLTPLTGLNLNLSLVDYQGLAHAKLGLGTLLKSLAVDGLAKQVTGTLVKDVLAQPIKLSLLLQIMSKDLDAAGDLVGGSVLRKASQQSANANVNVVLGKILHLDDDIQSLTLDYPGRALDATVGVLGVFNAAVTANNIGNGVNTGLSIPGLAQTSVELMVGESAQTARTLSISEDLPSVQTDQIRMRTQVQSFGVLDLLNVRLNVPIELVVAGGTAKVTSTTCSSDPALREVQVQAMPGVAKLALGKWTGPLKDANTHDRLSPAVLANVLIATVEGDSYASIQQITPVTLVFKGAEIGNGTVKTAKTSSIAASLVQSLLKETNITVRVGVIGLPVSGILSSVAGLLTGMTQPIDNLLNTALTTAGVSIGELDVRVDDLVCDTPKIIG